MEPKDARYSFLIPFRDKVSLVNNCLKTLASAVEQDLDQVEVVLIDNGSNDDELTKLAIPDQLSTKTIHVDEPFNFQKLNNAGAAAASGNVLVLLNNDIVFPESAKGFLPRMSRHALQEHIGAVGPLLYYPDGTIQHAGVVVGMDTYAEHVYRGWTESQADQFPFASHKQNRPVSAVTAAFLMIEKTKFDAVQGMNESFIVCGGDVDLCIRLEEQGYTNLYLGEESFIHEESKSRGTSAIPEVDFVESRRSYDMFLDRHGGRDPFYPAPLPLTHVHQGTITNTGTSSEPTPPTMRKLKTRLRGLKRRMEEEPIEIIAAHKLHKLRQRFVPHNPKSPDRFSNWFQPSVIAPAAKHFVSRTSDNPRINLVLPHFDEFGVFAGITTACILAMKLKLQHPEWDLRFVFVDDHGDMTALRNKLRKLMGDQVDTIEMSGFEVFDRDKTSLPIHTLDFFITTAWWTCYQAKVFAGNNPFIYLVQDFEPAFYAWGDRYQYCLETYSMNFVPVFNTTILRDYFAKHGYIAQDKIERGSVFEPAVDKSFFARPRKRSGGKRKLMFYAREGIARNLFPYGVLSLAKAIESGVLNPEEWEIISAGQPHHPVNLPGGVVLQSSGKLSLDEYANLLAETDVGLSLMLSPHPSYPPLEMAAAGVQVVTNQFENKNLADRSNNFISVNCTPEALFHGLKTAIERVTSKEFTPDSRLDFPATWDESLKDTLNFMSSFVEKETQTRLTATRFRHEI